MKRAQVLGITLVMKVEEYGYGNIQIIPREDGEYVLTFDESLKVIPKSEKQGLIRQLNERLEPLLSNKKIEL